MSGFVIKEEISIGYSGERPLSVSPYGDVVIPCAAGGLTSINIESGAAEWWTAADGSRQLSCLARHPSGNTLAVAERRMKAKIHVLGAQRRVIQRLEEVCKLQVIDMNYSRDGSRFVALADAPTHNFSVYSVEPQSEKLQLLMSRRDAPPSEHQFSHVSFNPRSNLDLCTSGGGHLTFWKMDQNNPGSPAAMVSLQGRVARPNLRITVHEWSIVPGGAVVAGTTNGLMLLFNISNGTGEVAFDCCAKGPSYYGDVDERDEAQQQQQPSFVAHLPPNAPVSEPGRCSVVGIVVTKHHTVVLTEDGTMRFLACIREHGGGPGSGPGSAASGSQGNFNMNNSMVAAQNSGISLGVAGAAASMTLVSNASMALTNNASFTSNQYGAAAAAAAAQASGPQQLTNVTAAQWGPVVYTLQRWMSVPLIESASCLAAALNWNTLLVGCKTSGTLTALQIPGYERHDLDAASFVVSDIRQRIVTTGTRSPIVGSVFIGPAGKHLSVLDTSGVLRTIDIDTRREDIDCRVHVGLNPSVLAASTVVDLVLVGSETGTLRVYQHLSAAASGQGNSGTMRERTSDSVSNAPIRLIVPHPSLPLAVAVAGESTLIFVNLAEPVRVYGLCDVPDMYEGISTLAWGLDDAVPFFVFGTNNSTVVVGRYPQEPILTEDLVYPSDDIITNSWRTELPLTALTVAMTNEVAILCFAGCVDRETKFFNLDRSAAPERKDRESKPLKMPLVFRDHEKQIVAIQIVGPRLITAGADGRLVVRDVSCLLSSAPNLREVRKDAVAIAPRHVSLLGGIKSISVTKHRLRLATTGHDGATLTWTMGTPAELNSLAASSSELKTLVVSPETNFWHNSGDSAFPTMAPPARAPEETLDFREKRRQLALSFDRGHAAAEHQRIFKRVAELRDKLKQVYQANEEAPPEEKVDLLDFLVSVERKTFEQKCANEIVKMKQSVRMEDLRCDFTADYIKRTRWDTMKTQLNVLEGLLVAPENSSAALHEENVKVYNFAVPVDDPQRLATLRKVKFLRRMQERSKHLAQLKAEQQHSSGFDPHNQRDAVDDLAALGHQQGFGVAGGALGGAMAQATAAAHHGGGHAGGESSQPGHDNNNNNQFPSNSPSREGASTAEGGEGAGGRKGEGEDEASIPVILNAATLKSVDNSLGDVQPFLFEPRDCFARVRAIMQSHLLAARGRSLRVVFNEKFNALVNEKKTILAQAAERTAKCRVIQLQLGDKRKLVECKMSSQEQPEVVLSVADDDVKEDRTHDPTYKAKLAKLEAEQDRWRRVHGSDDAPERALKTWMDGRLDKEILQIVAKMDPPDFADEKSSKHVPQDDWSDEQQKIYREYEKKYEKLVEDVENQRRNLERDLTQMQAATAEAITAFDAAVSTLFRERVRVSQLCSQAELARLKLAFNFMEYVQIEAELAHVEQHRVELQNKLIAASEATSRFRQMLDIRRQQLAKLKTDEQNIERNLKGSPPFSTSPELLRWWNSQQAKRKRGGRARFGPDAHAKKQARSAAAAARDDQQANAGPIAPDPWEFLEREAWEQAEARRQEALIHANGAAAQYPDRPDAVNEHVWQDFLDYIDDRAAKERQIKKMAEEISELTQEDGRLAAVEDELRSLAEDSQRQRDMKQRELLEALFDVDQLLVFRQGHVEYAQDPFLTEYGYAALIETARVQALNSDIISRGKEKIVLMQDEALKAGEVKQLDWDTRHAEFQTKILELEHKQLMALKVTKQMQEFIGGGGEDHNERQRAKLKEKIDHVRKTMTQRIEDKKAQMSKVRRQTREREIENTMLVEQVNHADALLATRRHVHTVHGVDTDAELPQRLMRDMRVTRRLEDVARAQNDEMAALKREVDRLRERTFPSFAVVSKRVIGSGGAPDASAFHAKTTRM